MLLTNIFLAIIVAIMLFDHIVIEEIDDENED